MWRRDSSLLRRRRVSAFHVVSCLNWIRYALSVIRFIGLILARKSRYKDTLPPHLPYMTFLRWITLKPSVAALIIVSLVMPLAVLAEGPAFDVRPVPTKTPPPEYPYALKRNGVSGVVAVKVLIDVNGSVAECSVSKSSDPGFDAAALDAVKKWKFKPAKKDGASVEARLIIPIQFRIDD